MQFSTAALTFLATLLASPVAAMHDPAACNGIGACTVPSECNYATSLGEPTDASWDCGSGGTIPSYISSGAQMQSWQGLSKGQVVPRAEFPRCDLAQPSASATLLKTTYEGVTVFGWIEYSCTETTPLKGGCYSTEKNKSAAYVCKVFQGGQPCKNLGGKLVREGSCPK